MKTKINISLFLISFGVFIYQVSLLRILSVADFYHFAFLIVSIALLGFGISGSFLPFFVSRIKTERLLYIIFSLGFSISAVVSFLAINFIPFDSFKIAWEARQLLYLFIYYLFLILPFFFGGCFVGYVFYGEQKPQTTYFFNLTGSSLGAIAFLILVPVIQQRGIIILSSALGIISVFILLNKNYAKIFIPVTVIFIVAAGSLFLLMPGLWEINMSPYKSLKTVMRYPDSRLIYTAEDSATRVDVVESSSIKSAPGLSLIYEGVPPDQLGLTIDGDNLTPITRSEHPDNDEALKFLEYIPQSVFMKDKKYNNILIIEPGGGLDVLCSLYYGDSNICVVQNNELVVELLESRLSSYSGQIYKNPGVTVEKSSIRNFSLTTDKSFDLIVLSLSDSFHPVSSGAYSLNENYIYTVESISSILKLLSEDGILAITRWAQTPPSENLKTVATLVSALELDSSHTNPSHTDSPPAGSSLTSSHHTSPSYTDISYAGQFPAGPSSTTSTSTSTPTSSISTSVPPDVDISNRIFAYRSWSTVTTLYKNSGFSATEIDDFKKRVEYLNYDLVYYSGMSEDEANRFNTLEEPYFYRFFTWIIEGNNTSRKELYRNYYFNIEPATDNNPYFYNFFKTAQIPDIIKYFGKSTQPFGGGGYLILVAALLISILLSLLFIILPVKTTGSPIKLNRDYGYLIYFLSLGMGYFFIELPLMQKFILVLGKPSYSVAIILFGLMLFAGFGSFFAGCRKINLTRVVLVLIVYIMIFMLTFRFSSNFILARPLWQRFLMTIALIAPAGFLMGMPFPTGIARAKEKNSQIIPWLWAINGCASVVSSIAAVIISIHAGFLLVVGLSSLFYLAAVFFYKKL